MRITVVGGSGYIGSRLVGALAARGHDVRAFATSPGALAHDTVTVGDVRDASALARALAGSDAAINLAACPADAPGTAAHYAINVGGAHNLVAAATAAGVARLVFLSTVAVYGLDQPLAHEDAALRPFNDYGRSKAQAEAVYRQWAADDARRSLTVLRPSVVFGEGDRGNVRALIDHRRRGRFVMIGRGDNRKSIAYVGNLVDCLCARVDAAPGTHVLNYADKPDLSMRDLIARIDALLPGARRVPAHVPYALALAAGYLGDAVAAVARRPLALGSERVRKFCAETTVSTDTLARTGFVPRWSIDEALARTVASILAERA